MYPSEIYKIKIGDDRIYVNNPVNMQHVIDIFTQEEYLKGINLTIYKIIFKFKDGGRLEQCYPEEHYRDVDQERDQNQNS